MSLSINTPVFTRIDNAPIDHSPKTPETISPPSIAGKPAQNLFSTAKGDVTVDSATLNKLFDMMELVFKALREMFAGKQAKSSVLPDKVDVPDVKLEAATDSSTSKTDELPLMTRNALKQLSTPVLAPELKPEMADTPDPDTGHLPKAILNTLKHQTAPILPPVSKPEVTVTNDANANVHVSVNIDHCHCPDTNRPLRPGRNPATIPQLLVSTPVPEEGGKLEVTPRLVPEMNPHTDQELKVDPQLEVPHNHPPQEEKLDIASPGPDAHSFGPRHGRFNMRSGFGAR
ncbi:hypothetical protein HX799_21425 [Pseudomonas tolaasii]|uniref:hypothetical protein n=1 Tax=Pseudomonas tolaasii TaxID=29442 RepID=UPI0015B9314E|nr:hypothetical protein [Pseudomonas tolaasii]NWC53730.1 hypothetical protein [Pseudomonas tolaasii]NWE64757.1 hypothetical protein [Pseudomonas tolaasii]